MMTFYEKNGAKPMNKLNRCLEALGTKIIGKNGLFMSKIDFSFFLKDSRILLELIYANLWDSKALGKI